MARYFINFDEQDGTIVDTEGRDFPDLENATSEVIVAMRDIIADHIRHGRTVTINSIAILDEAGRILSKVTLWDALAGILPNVPRRLPDPV